MHRSLIALTGAATIGLASVPAPANAWCVGCAVGAGILGGIAAGAIVGSAIARPYYYYPPGYYYPPPPPGYYPPPGAYYPPPPAAEGPPPAAADYAPPPPGPAPAYAQLRPGCHWGKRKVKVEGLGYQWRTIQVCP